MNDDRGKGRVARWCPCSPLSALFCIPGVPLDLVPSSRSPSPRISGVLIGVPLVAGFVVSRLIAGPLWSWAEGMDAGAFALKDEQKVAGAQKLHAEELRIRMVRHARVCVCVSNQCSQCTPSTP